MIPSHPLSTERDASSVSKKQSQKEVLKKQRPKRVNRKRTSMISRSNILKRIINNLENGKYQHMLYWVDRMKRVFVVKFVHMNSKEFKKADYLALFKDLDELSNNYEEYLKDEKYKHNCKVRCKSNLKKLCDNGPLTLEEKMNKGKSIQLRKYKLNDDSMLGVNNPSSGENMNKRYVNGFSGRETVHRIPYSKGKFNIANLPSEQSHYLCLSKHNSINVYINILAGGISTSSVSPVEPTLLDTYYTTENGNQDERNAMLIEPSMTSPVEPTMLGTYGATESRNENAFRKSVKPPQLGGERKGEFNIDEQQPLAKTIKPTPAQPQMIPSHPLSTERDASSVVAVPAMSRESLALCGLGSYSIEENEKCESMEYSEFLVPKILGNLASQNVVALPAMSRENLALCGLGSCYSIEENDKCESMEYSELEVQKIQADVETQNIEEFQDVFVETKNSSQLVPSSPLDVKEICIDPYSEYDMDYKPDIDKPLQRDNDPLLSSTSTDILSTNLSEENDYLPSDTEGFYSFENLSSFDAD